MRVIVDLGKLSYGERLQRLGLFTLERSRIRRSLIKMPKILSGLEKIKQGLLHSLAQLKNIGTVNAV